MEAAVTCPTNASSLRYDTACLQVHNAMSYPVNLYSVSSECVQVSVMLFVTGNNFITIISMLWPTS